MGKIRSSLGELLSRILKGLTVAVLLPVVVGLLVGVRERLAAVDVAGTALLAWVDRGALTYAGIHLLLYRPEALFRASHRVFSTIAVWLFGGQVASVDQASSGGGRRAKKGDDKGKDEKAGKRSAGPQGSVLVAFSPYVVPIYTILVCLAGWGSAQFAQVEIYRLAPIVGFLAGLTLMFHWLMTADDLQEQRSRWHLETYLIAVALVFLVTLVIGAACLPWAVPEFSFGPAVSEGVSRAQSIYATLIQRLFF